MEAALYCDFCLGDALHNKKTGGGPEELIGEEHSIVQPPEKAKHIVGGQNIERDDTFSCCSRPKGNLLFGTLILV